ncbi:MAG: hypothetical protein GY775_16700 [Candidatus Scalindua sp.]|nr:hypothetical protein [Candidatus Scalindua sp.]
MYKTAVYADKLLSAGDKSSSDKDLKDLIVKFNSGEHKFINTEPQKIGYSLITN